MIKVLAYLITYLFIIKKKKKNNRNIYTHKKLIIYYLNNIIYINFNKFLKYSLYLLELCLKKIYKIAEKKNNN